MPNGARMHTKTLPTLSALPGIDQAYLSSFPEDVMHLFGLESDVATD